MVYNSFGVMHEYVIMNMKTYYTIHEYKNLLYYT